MSSGMPVEAVVHRYTPQDDHPAHALVWTRLDAEVLL